MAKSSRLQSLFNAPTNAFRGKPFWSWNSVLEKKELLRQVGVMEEMGMGGFFMHSRTGLQTPYMGQEWLEAIKACAKEAEKHGMEAWLYDEDRWPSGAAGGIATANPKNRMRYLRCEILTPEEMATREKKPVVAVFAATVDGLNLSAYRPRKRADAPLAPGEKIILFTIEFCQPHTFFNGGTYLNTIDAAAVQEFIRVTHEAYKKSCGSMFGGAIPGIFTDEPHHGFVMAETPTGWLYPANSGWITPWTDDLPAKFEAAFGHDLRARLPELFLRRQGEKLSPVKWQYMELLHRLFLDCWARPLFEWCRANNMRMTGHLLAEDLPGDQSITCGSVLRYYELMDTPGMDQLLLNNDRLWMAKQVASSARQFGRKWMMSELYGCTGWQLDFAGHKEIGDWQAFLGINLRCHHLSWYSMAGEAKRDFPASIFFQSAWFREYRVVEDYFSRVNVLMQQGGAVCDILVLHPVESVWAQVHAEWGAFIKTKSPDIAPIDETFMAVFRWITGAFLDFDYGDEEQLSRLGRVEKREGVATLKLGQSRYRTVVIAGLVTLRSTTLRQLEKFRAAGGTVIFVGDPPAYVDALPSSAPRDFSRQAIAVPLTREALTKALHQSTPPLVSVKISGQPAEKLPVLLQTRRDREGWIVALCNTDAKREFTGLTMTFAGSVAQVQEWDCRTGKRYAVSFKSKGGRIKWKTSLALSGERLFRLVTIADATLQPRPARRKKTWRRIEGPFTYRLDEPNAFVLDRFEWRTNSGRWQSPTDILAIDLALRQSLGLPTRGHGMTQPWARKKSKVNPRADIALRASFEVKTLLAGDLHLSLEQPQRWGVKLNGKALPTTADEGWFIDPCFRRIPVSRGVLRAGKNVLELTAKFEEGLEMEAVHLLGDFGVYGVETENPFIDQRPDVLEIGDVCPQGLPHYTGRIQYVLSLPGASTRARKVRLPSLGGAVACLHLPDGAEPVLLPFQPYETELPAGAESLICEVILTRRNLFGPLHLVPKEQNAITPWSFRVPGAAYAAPSQLYPSGLLAAPEVAEGPKAVRGAQ